MTLLARCTFLQDEENGCPLKMLGMSATGRLLLDSVVPINVNTL